MGGSTASPSRKGSAASPSRSAASAVSAASKKESESSHLSGTALGEGGPLDLSDSGKNSMRLTSTPEPNLSNLSGSVTGDLATTSLDKPVKGDSGKCSPVPYSLIESLKSGVGLESNQVPQSGSIGSTTVSEVEKSESFEANHALESLTLSDGSIKFENDAHNNDDAVFMEHQAASSANKDVRKSSTSLGSELRASQSQLNPPPLSGPSSFYMFEDSENPGLVEPERTDGVKSPLETIYPTKDPAPTELDQGTKVSSGLPSGPYGMPPDLESKKNGIDNAMMAVSNAKKKIEALIGSGPSDNTKIEKTDSTDEIGEKEDGLRSKGRGSVTSTEADADKEMGVDVANIQSPKPQKSDNLVALKCSDDEYYKETDLMSSEYKKEADLAIFESRVMVESGSGGDKHVDPMHGVGAPALITTDDTLPANQDESMEVQYDGDSGGGGVGGEEEEQEEGGETEPDGKVSLSSRPQSAAAASEDGVDDKEEPRESSRAGSRLDQAWEINPFHSFLPFYCSQNTIYLLERLEK